MAIEDRNLTAGTKLWAKYKGEVHRAEVVAHADEHGNETIAYRLSDGREFKSPSAAGGAVFGEGRTCNGWAFWTVGEPPETTSASGADKATGETTAVGVPKPTPRARGRRRSGQTA